MLTIRGLLSACDSAELNIVLPLETGTFAKMDGSVKILLDLGNESVLIVDH